MHLLHGCLITHKSFACSSSECLRAAHVRKKKQSPNYRASWTDEETEVLIRLWKENLGGLHGQKRNGKMNESMTAALARCGIIKSRAQVHSKMENLRSKYRYGSLLSRLCSSGSCVVHVAEVCVRVCEEGVCCRSSLFRWCSWKCGTLRKTQ